jgi:hypothetical protein
MINELVYSPKMKILFISTLTNLLNSKVIIVDI